MEKYRIKDGILEAYTGREEVITVPEGVHTIGEGALKGCVSLRKVVLPSGLQTIMGDAFKGGSGNPGGCQIHWALCISPLPCIEAGDSAAVCGRAGRLCVSVL